MGRALMFLIVVTLVVGGVGYYAGWIRIGQGKVIVDGKEVEKDASMDPYSKGWAQFQSLQYGAALDTYQRALRERPDDKEAPTARFAMAKCYRELKRPAESIKAYEDFIRRYPTDSRVQEAQKQHDLLVQFNQ